MPKPKLLALLAVLAALLCLPAAAAANGAAKTHVHQGVGTFEIQIHANPHGYQLDSLRANLRSCHPEAPGATTGCSWQLTGIRDYYGHCAAAVHHGTLEERAFRVFTEEANYSMSLSVRGTHHLPLPGGGSGGASICWYVQIHGRPGTHLLAETRFG
jgi:hypothetical protein